MLTDLDERHENVDGHLDEDLGTAKKEFSLIHFNLLEFHRFELSPEDAQTAYSRTGKENPISSVFADGTCENLAINM